MNYPAAKIIDRKGVGYFRDVKFSVAYRLEHYIRKENPECRRYEYASGHAYQTRESGPYYTAVELQTYWDQMKREIES